MWCIVNLPNGTQQAVKWDAKAIGQECLEKVCKAFGIICEMEYFGLEPWTPNQEESRTRQWINLRNRLSCDNSSGIQLLLALRVKFWVPVHFILQESVRELFYTQAKMDLIEGRLNAHDWSNAAKLAALLCQADGIRFNELALDSKCPLRMQNEHDILKQQQQLQYKDRKEREHVLSFKKRRLSKQKSIENIESAHYATSHSLLSSTSLVAASTSNSTASVHPSIRNSRISTFASPDFSVISVTSRQPTDASIKCSAEQSCADLEARLAACPLRIYQMYIIRTTKDLCIPMPDDFLRQIAIEHGKLSTLKMPSKAAKYWLLHEIQDLPGYGEEVFSGVTTSENSVRCDISVGAHGLTVATGKEKNRIPFSAIAAAKSFRRTFKLEYVDDQNDRRDLEIKLPKHVIAAGLYRSITERHAFYVCDKVRGVVTNQFTRDLKGTIASMFKEDTELGKRYVFDIQHTCREVHDQARRILHERGVDITTTAPKDRDGVCFDDIVYYMPKSLASYAEVESSDDYKSSKVSCIIQRIVPGYSLVDKIDLVIRERKERVAVIERCVDVRISEAMSCKICLDRVINSMFNPCCHVMACAQCAARCTNCPNCREKISSVVKIYLPPELRTNQSSHFSTSTVSNT